MAEQQNNDPKRDPSNQQGPGPFMPRFGPLLLILLLFTLPWMGSLFGGFGRADVVPYSFFIEQLNEDNVSSVEITGEQINGVLSEETSYTVDGRSTTVEQFRTFIPESVDHEYLQRLNDENVQVVTRPTSDTNFFTILLNFLPFLILIFIFYRFWKGMRQQGGGGMQGMFSIGKNKAKQYGKGESETTFDDVAGAESAKTEVQEIVEFLKEPKRFLKMGAKTPHGVLLVGPPGSGKTLLARAIAGEAGVPFFSISGSDFVEMFVGVGAKRVRSLFEDAKKNAPSIIFIDELDSIGRRRGAGLGGGHDEREQTLNQLLSEMDGFEQNESTIVFAATNRPDVLDPALLRPGRFDRRVTVPAPALKDREKILQIHARKKPMAEDVDLERVAKSTSGFSGADLENLLNEAALLAARKHKETINDSDIAAARDKIILGLERSGVVMDEEERKTVAYHEAGHAVVAATVPNAEPVHKVTIVPRERAMGVTEQLPEGDRYLYRKDYVLDRIAVMMGGRAAEKFKIGPVTSGAENDLKQAQKLVRKMVLDWGMSDSFQNVAFGSESQDVFLGQELAQKREYSDETARRVDQDVQELMQEAFDRAYKVLQENEEGLDRLAERLLEQEELTAEEVREIVGRNGEEKSKDSRKRSGKERQGEQK
ncbi:MAG: ATP-dependent zinc metalloprotease FtsH [Spirochaetaceae bacterium]